MSKRLIVSNNARNRNLESVLAARITTTRKHAAIPTVIPLTPADPLVGFVLCHDIVGSLCPPTIAAVSEGVRIALGLR